MSYSCHFQGWVFETIQFSLATRNSPLRYSPCASRRLTRFVRYIRYLNLDVIQVKSFASQKASNTRDGRLYTFTKQDFSVMSFSNPMRKSLQAPPLEAWVAARERVTSLYLHGGLSLAQVIDRMREEHGFKASCATPLRSVYADC
jgi:Clr5 domain